MTYEECQFCYIQEASTFVEENIEQKATGFKRWRAALLRAFSYLISLL
jgi:hypothetical protein